MSVSKILKFKDDGLEFTIEIRNQEFELSLQLEKQIEVAGYPNILIKPMVHCKATNDNASSSVEVPYEIFPVDLEEQRKKLENEISVLVEEGKKEREEIQKRQEELKNELDELTKYDEEEVKEEVKESSNSIQNNTRNVEIKYNKKFGSKKNVIMKDEVPRNTKSKSLSSIDGTNGCVKTIGKIKSRIFNVDENNLPIIKEKNVEFF